MSQSANKSKGSNMMMPLAIGGGLLLLFMGIKKSQAKSQHETDPNAEMLTANSLLPQSNAAAAPKYTDIVDSEEAAEMNETVATPRYAANNNGSSNYNAATPPEEDDTANSEGYSSSYSESNSNTKWNERQGNRIVGNEKPKMGKQQNAEQAKLAQQKARNNKPSFSPIPFIAKTQKAIAQKNAAAKIFPLKQGQTNNYIKEVQRKMGVSPTGFFGTQTKSALQKKYKAVEVSEALYKQIMTGKAVAAKPIIPLKKMTPLPKKAVKILPKRKIVAKKR